MNTTMELLGAAFILLLWLTCVFEAFDGLSGGRIRKIESKNKKLSEKLENWMEQGPVLRAVLKLILFVLAALTGCLAYASLRDMAPDFPAEWALAVIAGAVVIASGLSELLARFILFRCDIAVLRTAIPLLSLLSCTLFLPFTWLVKRVTKAADDWHKKDDDEEKVSVEDEILSYVESYNDDSESDLEEGEKQMIRGILDLSDKSVHEIMTPRVDLDALPETATVDEARKLFISSGHSRIPVFGKSIDEIKGIIYAKDFLDEHTLEGRTLLQLSHEPIFIPETKEVGELLEEIKHSHNHFAVIIDEYGGTSGVVTFEDIIEEIVGDVQDEYDSDEDNEVKPQLMPDGSIVLEARTLISEIMDITDTEIPDNDTADTIGGYICSQLGRIPSVGETYTIPGQLNATILEADERKIDKIKIELIDDSGDDTK